MEPGPVARRGSFPVPVVGLGALLVELELVWRSGQRQSFTCGRSVPSTWRASVVGDRRPEDGGTYNTLRTGPRAGVRTRFGFVVAHAHEKTVLLTSAGIGPSTTLRIRKEHTFPLLPNVVSWFLRWSTRYRGHSMLLTIGKFALVAALAFAAGTFFGREHPSDRAVAHRFTEIADPVSRQIIEQAFKHAFDATPTATPSP